MDDWRDELRSIWYSADDIAYAKLVLFVGAEIAKAYERGREDEKNMNDIL